MNLNEIVLLKYSLNPCYVEVVNIEEAIRRNPDLQIDLEKRTWSHQEIKGILIGQGRKPDYCYSNGPIGVYDRTNDKHLDRMVNDAVNALEEDRFSED